jgi:hypothetical protein
MHLAGFEATKHLFVRLGHIVVILLIGMFSRAVTAEEVGPSPSLAPADVVNLQLQALQHNDDPAPNAGIAKVFRFASPANKEVTGPLAHFEQIVRSPAYAVMINARSSQITKTNIEGNRAEVTVIIVSNVGGQSGFTFILSKQSDGDFRDCWMTDSVLQVGSEQANPGDIIQV